MKSYSQSRPHLIKVKKCGQYCCDGDCPNWQSLHLCSHTVATAEKEGELQAFVQWYKKLRAKPSLTKLITTTMPKGRGCKGGIAPPKKKKKISGTSKTRVPFSAMCNSSKQQGVASESADLTPDIGCDEHYTVSESVGTSICNEDTSGIEPTPDSNSTEESLVHTLTLSSGSSSQAHASSGFISHCISLPTGQASSTGFVSATSAMPSVPPPLIPCNTSPVIDSPFMLRLELVDQGISSTFFVFFTFSLVRLELIRVGMLPLTRLELNDLNWPWGVPSHILPGAYQLDLFGHRVLSWSVSSHIFSY